MDNIDINKLRELPIEGVAERLGLEVKRHKALCPFHDDSHPSLTFNVRKNTYKCFVCGAHGGVIDLVMNHLKLAFVDACRWLADANNIILSDYKPVEKPEKQRRFDASKYCKFFEHPFINNDASNFLFNERGLDRRVVDWCRLNSFKEWLQIPYYDIDGNLIGVQWRYIGQDKSKPRFKFPYGSTCHIYNMPVLKLLKPNEPLFITEGASDCWAMLSSGHKAIAIPSATLLNRKDIKMLEDMSKAMGAPLNLHMYPDADIPGEKLYIQLVQLANQIGACMTRHSLPEGCKDYSDYYVRKIKNNGNSS